MHSSINRKGVIACAEEGDEAVEGADCDPEQGSGALVLTLASIWDFSSDGGSGQAELYHMVLKTMKRMLETGSSGPKQWP
jgi:hypothetical protein